MCRWLREFRRATPRDARQALIDGATAGALLRELEGLPPAARAGRWPLVVYLLAARALQGPPLADDDQVNRLAAVFTASPNHLRTDMRRMAAQLVRDDRRWRRRRDAFLERERKRAARAAGPAPTNSPTCDFAARR